MAWVKIAPGERAKYWDQCREGGYVCVGWNKVGDLTKFLSKEEFQESFKREYLERYNGHLSVVRQKANELWTLVELLPGDKIVANRGVKEILAVGTVQEPGCRWRPTRKRDEYYHTVKVRWDESFRKIISPQPWNQTVKPVPYDLVKKITGSSAPPTESVRSLDDLEDERKRIERTFKDRQGQPKFRDKMLRIYQSRCAVSDCDASEALQAAHIRPYISPKSNHPCNGLLLRADLHNLFDKHLLGIHPRNLRIFISPSLMSTVYQRFDGKTLRIPKRTGVRPDRKCLEDRYRLYRDQNGLA